MGQRAGHGLTSEMVTRRQRPLSSPLGDKAGRRVRLRAIKLGQGLSAFFRAVGQTTADEELLGAAASTATEGGVR